MESDLIPRSPKIIKRIGFHQRHPKTIVLVGNFNHPKLGTIILMVLDFQGHNGGKTRSEKAVATYDIWLFCTPKIGEDEPILTFAYFSRGLVQPPTRRYLQKLHLMSESSEMYDRHTLAKKKTRSLFIYFFDGQH